MREVPVWGTRSAIDTASVKLKVPKSSQMEAFAFVGSSKGTLDTIDYDKQSPEACKAAVSRGTTTRRLQSPVLNTNSEGQ